MKTISRRIRGGWLLAALSLWATGCGTTTSHLAVNHRHLPRPDARIVVLPIALPETIESGDREGRTLANMYATELLRSYEILEYERFRRSLESRQLTLDNLLVDGQGLELLDELQLDGVLLGEVYSWQEGKPGIWILASPGTVGFQARLVDLRSGSVIWSVNRVSDTKPTDTLSMGLASVFRELAAKMPKPEM